MTSLPSTNGPLEPCPLDLTREAYARHAKPGLLDKLSALRLDKCYVHAEGDHLTYRDQDGRDRRVLDLVGGFGSTLFGHNPPPIVAAMVGALIERVPVHSQGSVKPNAALLAQRLSDGVRRTTGKEYVVTLGNSGAEAVEAAIKHALLEWNVWAARTKAAFDARVFDAIRGAAAGRLSPTEPTRALAAECGWDHDPVEALLAAIRAANYRALARPPAFLSRRGGFHGKTTGALKLTFNPTFREPFGDHGFEVRFLGEDPALWGASLQQGAQDLFSIEVSSIEGTFDVKRERRPWVAGLILEPVQGEGGVHPVPPALVRWIDSLAQRRFPIIVDEIQSGMGRSGAFLASSLLGLVGDYYCLGKSLGGSVVKLSAMLVERSRFVKEYATLHTSTFAEDELSSRVGLRVLDLLEEGGVAEKAAETGRYLLERLEGLRQQFPAVIREVRGLGLMVGVELASQAAGQSAILRLVDQNEYLGYLVSGYLLNEHDIRVMPTLSSPRTIRVQPSSGIARAELDRFVAALAAACRLIETGNVGALLRHIGVEPGEGPEVLIPVPPPRPRLIEESPEGRFRVAFLGHLLEPRHLRLRDASFEPLREADLERLIEKTHRLFDRALVAERINVRSSRGAEVNLTFLGHFLTAEAIHKALAARDHDWIRQQVLSSVRWAKEERCGLVGFGGYTSMVVSNCLNVPVSGIGVTSGNALTVGFALEAVDRELARRGLSIDRLCAGVLGATGNIGGTCAEILADRARSVLLVGRPAAARRLRDLAARLIHQAVGPESEERAGGIAATLRATPAGRDVVALARASTWPQFQSAAASGLLDRPAVRAAVQVSTELRDLRQCQVIVAASNHPHPIVGPEHVGEGDVIVCDIAVPQDTMPELPLQRPRVKVIQGGLVKLPLNPDFQVGGIPLDPGQAYACMAETLLLGLERRRTSFSRGMISKAQVREILALAAKHGFAVAESRVKEPSRASEPPARAAEREAVAG